MNKFGSCPPALAPAGYSELRNSFTVDIDNTDIPYDNYMGLADDHGHGGHDHDHHHHGHGPDHVQGQQVGMVEGRHTPPTAAGGGGGNTAGGGGGGGGGTTAGGGGGNIPPANSSSPWGWG